MRVKDLGFRVQDLGFRAQGLGFRVFGVFRFRENFRVEVWLSMKPPERCLQTAETLNTTNGGFLKSCGLGFRF